MLRNRPTGSPDSAAGYFDQGQDAESTGSAGTGRAPTRNVLLRNAEFKFGQKSFRLAQPHRLMIEDFGPEGVLVFLVSDQAFSGFGENETLAVHDVMVMLLNDFIFYQSTADDELTADARDSKSVLSDLLSRRKSHLHQNQAESWQSP